VTIDAIPIHGYTPRQTMMYLRHLTSGSMCQPERQGVVCAKFSGARQAITGSNICYMRRIWPHRISFFVPRPRDTAHPGSGPAQGRLRLCSGFAQACSPLLRLSTIFGTLRRSILNCFNSSRVGPELVPYIKMVKISPYFENEQPHLYLLYFFVLPT